MTCDYLIIGGGIIGLAIARCIISSHPGTKIVLIEKEADVAMHGSGRNSGVLHAGFYYSADSLKARFTRIGNAQMRDYCMARGLRINECKKVVVTKNEDELKVLFELKKRGDANGVNTAIIDEHELRSIDPNIRTYKYALYSPSTATVDPVEICLSIKRELKESGVVMSFNEAYMRRVDRKKVLTSGGKELKYEKLINAAGLYADKIARDFGYSKGYTIIPFKGVYLEYKGTNKPVSTNVYPVPRLINPFLGVHYTVTVDGNVKIGPTSVPAFWRENYEGTANLKISEMTDIIKWEARLFLLNSFGFRNLALEEIKKYCRKYFISLAQGMVKKIDPGGFSKWGKPGIRAQLLNIHTKELIMDFVVEGDKESTHILNAVSPAFTCSMPFAKWVVSNYL